MIQRILLLIVFICSFPNLVFCENEIKIARGEYGNDYPPYYIVQKDGSTVGLCPEIIGFVTDKLNLKIKYIVSSWSGSLNGVKEGSIDALFPVSRTPERESFIYFFDNVLVNEQVALFTLKTSDIMFNGNLDTIKKYKIGAVRNYSYGVYFDSFKFDQKNISYGEDILLKRLIAKRTDLIVGDWLVMNHMMERYGVANQVKKLEPLINEVPVYLGFSIAANKKKMAREFSDTLTEFKKTEEYRKILLKYGIK